MMGHQSRNSATKSILSSIDQPVHWNFILPLNSPNDWRSPQNDNLWQGLNGINNPFPIGYSGKNGQFDYLIPVYQSKNDVKLRDGKKSIF